MHSGGTHGHCVVGHFRGWISNNSDAHLENERAAMDITGHGDANEPLGRSSYLAITTLLMSTECNIMGTKRSAEWSDDPTVLPSPVPSASINHLHERYVAPPSCCYYRPSVSHVTQTFIIHVVIIIARRTDAAAADTDVTMTPPSTCLLYTSDAADD